MNSIEMNLEPKPYQHSDPQMIAILAYDSISAVWVIDYYKAHLLIASALYQSEATALLLLHSLGYTVHKEKIC